MLFSGLYRGGANIIVFGLAGILMMMKKMEGD